MKTGNKNNIRALVVLVILLAVYHAAAFLIPFAKTAVFWLSYVFTLLAFVLAAVAVWKGLLAPTGVKSKFYGFPIVRIGIVYLAVQTVLGLVLSALASWVPWWLAALVYAIGLGAAAVGLIGADAVVEEIGRQDDVLKKDVGIMRGLQSKVNALLSQCDDEAALSALRGLADELRYSDPVTSGTEESEAELAALTDELQKAVADGDGENAVKLCRRASKLLAERNRLCKLNKA